MELKSIILLIYILLAVADAIPFESSRDGTDIPPLIKNIYDRVNDNFNLKYLRIVKNLRWLAPFEHGEFIAYISGTLIHQQKGSNDFAFKQCSIQRYMISCQQ